MLVCHALCVREMLLPFTFMHMTFVCIFDDRTFSIICIHEPMSGPVAFRLHLFSGLTGMTSLIRWSWQRSLGGSDKPMYESWLLVILWTVSGGMWTVIGQLVDVRCC